MRNWFVCIQSPLCCALYLLLCSVHRIEQVLWCLHKSTRRKLLLSHHMTCTYSTNPLVFTHVPQILKMPTMFSAQTYSADQVRHASPVRWLW